MDSMSTPRAYDHVSSVGQDETRSADSSLALLSTNNAVSTAAPPQSSSEHCQESTISVITNYLKETSSPSTWLRLKLTTAEHDELEKSLPDEKFRGFRRDYFPRIQTFTVGMETKIHAVVRQGIEKAILNRFEELASQHPDSAVGRFAAKIRCESGDTIPLKVFKNSHDPDVSFRYKDNKFAGLVVEVAHSQSREDLFNLAENYILATKGSVGCVAAVKTEYRSGNRAWLFVWERKVRILADGTPQISFKQTVKNSLFRTAKGLANPACPGLCLPLRLLTTNEEVANELPEVPNDLSQIRITAEELCQFVDAAERQEAEAREAPDTNWGDEEPRLMWRKSRRPEEVSGDREMAFTEEEERAELRSEKEDPEYLG